MAFGGADLHSHSTFSDGIESPEALVASALEAGLAVLALTDHDAVHGLPDLESASRGTVLRTVAGVELSVRVDGDDLHVVGLFVDPEEPRLVARLAEMRVERERRGEAMVERLAALGMPLDLASIRVTVGSGAFGRPHVARAMVERGFASSVDDAFERWLQRGKPGYVPKARWGLDEAIGAVRGAGGLAILAHPVWYDDPVTAIGLATAAGIDGIEAIHADHSPEQEAEYTAAATARGLLISAGSDYHGPPDGRKRVGGCRLDEERWERLLAAAQRRHGEVDVRRP